MTDSIQLVKSLYAAFARGDLETIYAACDPKIEWYCNADPALIPWGGERKGAAGVRDFFAELLGHIEMEKFEPQQFLGGPDIVVVIGRSTARAKSSGGRLQDEWCHLHWIRGGKVMKFREYLDTHALVQGYNALDIHAPTTKPGAGKSMHH